jgi:hypothetical protein
VKSFAKTSDEPNFVRRRRTFYHLGTREPILLLRRQKFPASGASA